MKTELAYLLEELHYWPDAKPLTVSDIELLLAQAIRKMQKDKINQSYYETEA